MAEQFQFQKPIVVIYDWFTESFPFMDIVGRNIPLEEPTVSLKDSYIKWYGNNSREKFYVDIHLGEKSMRYKDSYNKDDLDRIYQCLKYVEEMGYDGRVPIGEVQCPYTGKKLRNITLSPYRYSYKKSVKLDWEDNNGNPYKYSGHLSHLDVFRMNIPDVNLTNDLEKWYAKEVIDLFIHEWTHTSPYHDKVVDGDVIADCVVKGKIAYKDPKILLEDKLFYVSVNGRFYKRKGKGNQYIDSPAIVNFDDKLQILMDGGNLPEKKPKNYEYIKTILEQMKTHEITLEQLKKAMDENP